MALEKVNPNSSAAEEPASLIWYPEMDIVFQEGISLEQNSKTSVTSLMLSYGG